MPSWVPQSHFPLPCHALTTPPSVRPGNASRQASTQSEGPSKGHSVTLPGAAQTVTCFDSTPHSDRAWGDWRLPSWGAQSWSKHLTPKTGSKTLSSPWVFWGTSGDHTVQTRPSQAPGSLQECAPRARPRGTQQGTPLASLHTTYMLCFLLA